MLERNALVRTRKGERSLDRAAVVTLSCLIAVALPVAFVQHPALLDALWSGPAAVMALVLEEAERYRTFETDYRAAWDRWVSGDRDVVFPYADAGATRSALRRSANVAADAPACGSTAVAESGVGVEVRPRPVAARR